MKGKETDVQLFIITLIFVVTFWACAAIGFAHLLGWNWHQCTMEDL